MISNLTAVLVSLLVAYCQTTLIHVHIELFLGELILAVTKK